MQKIASHIKNPMKFGKASKLAIQLIQAGSVKPETSDHFFAILEAAMSSSTSCMDPMLRADYHALFSAAQEAIEVRLWFLLHMGVFSLLIFSLLLEEVIFLDTCLTFGVDCSPSTGSKRIN